MEYSDIIIETIQQGIIIKYGYTYGFDEKEDRCIIDFFKSKKHWNLYYIIKGIASDCDYTETLNFKKKFYGDIDSSEMDALHQNRLKEAFQRFLDEPDMKENFELWLMIETAIKRTYGQPEAQASGKN